MIDNISALGAFATPTPEVQTDRAPNEEIEVLFAKLLLQEVRKSLPKDGLMSGPALDMFQGLFDDALAEQFAAAGGFGIADQLASQAVSRPATDWISPVAGSRSSNFGGRADPIHGGRRNHDGIDIAAPIGTPVRAAKAGRVVFAGKRAGYGNLVIVDHGGGLQSRYAHCNDLRAAVGRKVNAGDTIATVGSTGRSTGPHLHFEIRKNGTPINPDSHLE